MSNWSKVQTLPPELTSQVTALYGDNFPLVVRDCLSNYIEEWIRKWNESYDDLEIDYKEGFAQEFVRALIREINEQSSKQDDFSIRFQLDDASDKFQNMLPSNSLSLINHIKKCLDDEQRILQDYQKLNKNASEEEIIGALSNQIGVLRKEIDSSEEDIRVMNEEKKSIDLLLEDITKIPKMIDMIKPTKQLIVESEIVKKQNLLINEREKRISDLSKISYSWINKTQDLFAKNCDAMNIVFKALELWKQQNISHLNGEMYAIKHSLNQIQEWCEGMADNIWRIKENLERYALIIKVLSHQEETFLNDIIAKFRDEIDQAVTLLIAKTFIVDKHPPQILKTYTRFQSCVRILIGNKVNVKAPLPDVKAIFIKESQLKYLDREINASNDEIMNNTVPLQYDSKSKQLFAFFTNLQLRKVNRSGKKNLSVMDEKFAIMFKTRLKIFDNILYDIKVLSLPVVVIVHATQEPDALATIAWDNAFAEPWRTSFTVPEKVAWKRISALLNIKFKSAVGADLSQEDLNFLAAKAFRNHNLSDYDEQLLSWAFFARSFLPGRNFTFWEWFYAIIKLVRDHLKPFWDENNRFIYGFISREHAIDLLMKKPNGTFLLRFADSDPGALTIAYVKGHNDPVVLMIKPFTSNDFKIRSLADRIKDLQNLTFLYPDIPKDQVFSKYYENDESNSSSSGYIKPVLITQIPDWASCENSSPPKETNFSNES